MFVLSVAARPGQTDDLQWQVCSTRLPAQQFETDGVHGCAFEFENWWSIQALSLPVLQEIIIFFVLMISKIHEFCKNQRSAHLRNGAAAVAWHDRRTRLSAG